MAGNCVIPIGSCNLTSKRNVVSTNRDSVQRHFLTLLELLRLHTKASGRIIQSSTKIFERTRIKRRKGEKMPLQLSTKENIRKRVEDITLKEKVSS